jgi:hypothetical protein
MDKEFYAVIDKATNKQVGKGFIKKSEAKTKRNELQEQTKAGLPKENREDQSLWSFKVANGKDHPAQPTKH